MFPRSVSRTDRAGNVDGQPLIDEQLAKRSAPPRVPVGVQTAGILTDGAELASTRRRGVANDVSDLVSQPRGQEFGVEAEALGLRVGLGGVTIQVNGRHTALR